MHFNIYIDDETGAKLKQLALKRKETRNALVRQALQDWISRNNAPVWPKEVMEFQGIPDLTPFESHRDELLPPSEDPFA